MKVCPPGKRPVGPAPSNAGTFCSHQTDGVAGRSCPGGVTWHFESKGASGGSFLKPVCGERICRARFFLVVSTVPGSPGEGTSGGDFGEPLSALLVCLRLPSNPCPTFVTREKKSGSQWGKDAGRSSAKPWQAHRLASSPVEPRPRPSLPHQHLWPGPPCPGLRGAVALKLAPRGPALGELCAWGSHS